MANEGHLTAFICRRFVTAAVDLIWFGAAAGEDIECWQEKAFNGQDHAQL